MKKYTHFLAAVLFFLVLLSPYFSLAQTSSVADLNALVKQLQQQIEFLQKQVISLQAQAETSKKEAATTKEELKTTKSDLVATKEEVKAIREELQFTKTLARGSSGDEVKKLQEFLAKDKEIYPDGLITGFFGSKTEAAVKKWQEKHNIESVGIVGPKTLAQINKLFETGAISPTAAPEVLPAVASSAATPAQPATPATPQGIAATTTVPATPATPAVPATTAVAAITPSAATTSAVSSAPTTPSYITTQIGISAYPTCGERVLSVPDKYLNINQALAAAKPGDTIRLGAQTFTETEPVKLKSGICLEGAGIDKTNIVVPSSWGIQINNASYVIVKNLTVKQSGHLKNTSPAGGGEGGGISVLYSNNVKLEWCRLTQNAEINGGGLAIAGSKNIDVSRCLIDNNYAKDFGGGVSSAWSTVTFNNVTVAHNRASYVGGSIDRTVGGIYVVGGDVTVNSSIVWGNSGHDLFSLPEYKTSSRMAVLYVLLGESFIGHSLLLQDPLFISTTTYKLTLYSPAINAGNPDSNYNDPDGTRNDLGIYYYPLAAVPVSAATTAATTAGTGTTGGGGTGTTQTTTTTTTTSSTATTTTSTTATSTTATTTTTTTVPLANTGACSLANTYYVNKTGVNDLNLLKSVCTSDDYKSLLNQACQQNSSFTGQEGVMTRDANGNLVSSTCGPFGCGTRKCSQLAAYDTNVTAGACYLTTGSLSFVYQDPDSGSGYARLNVIGSSDYNTVKSICANNRDYYDRLTTTICTDNPSASGMQEAVTVYDMKGSPVTSGCASSGSCATRSCPPPSTPGSQTPIGHWKFDGNGNNEVSGGPTAVTVGSAVFNSSGGKYGGYAYLPSTSDYVKIPYSSTFDFASAFTVEFWFRQRSNQSTTQDLVYKGTSPNNYNFRVLRRLWDQYNFGEIIAGYTSATTGYWTQTSNPNQLAHNVWHHVVFTKDSSHSVYYLDGSLIYSSPDSPQAKTPASDIIVGNPAIDTDIDNLKIYNRALSSSEASQNYAAATAGRKLSGLEEQLANIGVSLSKISEEIKKLLKR